MSTKAKQEQIEQIEWDVIEGGNTDFAVNYPRAQWVHGAAVASGFMKSGGLFINAEQFPNFKGEGFETATLITRDNKEIAGFGSAGTKLAVIRVKQQWWKDDAGKNVPLRHVLCVVKGCDDLICISLKGPSKALEFQKAFNQHIGQNVATANRTKPQGAPPLEPFALWFPLQAAKQTSISSADGKSSSSVTMPEMSVPETLDREYVTSLWVGSQNYTRFAGYYRETEAWQKVPIIVKHDDADTHGETPTHTGGIMADASRLSPAQLDFIGGLVEAKSIDRGALQEMALTVSDGATNQVEQLNGQEATQLIDVIKAM